MANATHLEAGQVGGLDRLLVGVLAEIQHLGRIGLQRQRDRFQLVGGVGQPRQQRELGAVDAVELAARCGACSGSRASWLAASAPADASAT